MPKAETGDQLGGYAGQASNGGEAGDVFDGGTEPGLVAAQQDVDTAVDERDGIDAKVVDQILVRRGRASPRSRGCSPGFVVATGAGCPGR